MNVILRVLILGLGLASTAWGQSVVIVRQPASLEVLAGESARMEVEAKGEGDLRFQWSRGSNALRNETNAALVIPKVTLAAAGLYRVQIRDAKTSVTSEPATLTVLSPPVISSQPTNTAVAFGTVQRIPVGVLGTAPFRFQWEQDGTTLPSQTNRTLSLAITNVGQLGGYRLVVANRYGAVTSEVAQLTLLTNTVEFVTTKFVVSELQGAFVIPVRREGSTNRLSLPIRISGTARPEVDYHASGAAQVPLFANEGELDLRILDNTTVDAAREFTVELTPGDAPDVQIGPKSTATVSILDNDQANQPAHGFDAPVTSLVVLPDRRLLVAGDFETIHGIRRPRLARLSPEFEVDPTFVPSPFIAGSRIAEVLVQPDGGLVLRGEFPVDDARSGLLRRLLPDGSEDLAFVPLERSVNSVTLGAIPTYLQGLALDGAGRMLAAGAFFSRQSGDAQVFRPWVHLFADGSRDPVFAANVATQGLGVASEGVARTGDGRWFALLHFTDFKAVTNQSRLLLLDEAGVPDPKFPAEASFTGMARAITVDEEGRALVTGDFTAYAGTPVPGWARIRPDGSLDTTFTPPFHGSNVVQQLALAQGVALVRTRSGEVTVITGLRILPSLTITKDASVFALDPAGGLIIGSAALPNLTRIPLPATLGALSGVGMEAGQIAVSEGAKEARVPVRRVGFTELPLEVSYQVTAGSARAGIDFVESKGSLRFAALETRGEIVVPLGAQNATPNDDRTIRVELTAAPGATLYSRRTTCLVTLEDDDTGLIAETFVSEPKLVGTDISLVSTQKVTFARRVDERLVPQVFYEWGWASPPGAGGDFFASIWSGWIVPEQTGDYQFATFGDDGVRLWIDDALVLDYWRPTAALVRESGALRLEAGHPYPLALHLFEQNGASFGELFWRPTPTAEYAVVPRRVLRPGRPAPRPPTLKLFWAGYPEEQVQLIYGTTAGRPLTLEVSPDGGTWSFLAEGVTESGGRTSEFGLLPTRENLPAGARLRAVSVDGLATTNRAAVPYVVRTLTSAEEILEGSTNEVRLTLVANGEPPSSVVWLKDGVEVGNESTLVVRGSDHAAGGDYQAIIKTPSGQLVTPPGQVSLLTRPVVVKPLEGQRIKAGQTAVLEAGIRGRAPLSFQWWRDARALPEATQARLVLTALQPADSGEYSVVAANPAGTVTNGPVTLVVLEPVAFAQQPQGGALPVDVPVPLALDAGVTGSGQVRFQWRLNGQDVPGATNRSLQVPAATLANAGTYTLVIENEAGTLTSDRAEVRPTLPQLPGANDFAAAVVLDGPSGIVAGNNADATRDPGEPLHGGKPGGHSVWYRWTAPATGRATFSTRGSAMDTLLAAYTGTAVDALVEVASDDDALGDGFFTSEILFNATAGATYSIAVATLGNASGNYALGWNLAADAPTIPRILEHPVSQTRASGERVSLSVRAENAEEITWWFNGEVLPGVSGSPLVLPALEPRQAGTYLALVRGGGQVVSSHEAIVEIGLQPDVHSYDKPEAIPGVGEAGGGASQHDLRAGLGGGAPALLVSPGSPVTQLVNNAANTTQLGEPNHCDQITYRTGWLPVRTTQDGSLVVTLTRSQIPAVVALYDAANLQTPLACMTDGRLVLPSTQAFRLYFLAFGGTNEIGGEMEFLVATGVPPPDVPTTATSATVVLGGTLTLPAPNFPGANPPPVHEWRQNDLPIPGATSSQLTLSNASPDSVGLYSVILDNGIGRVAYAIARVDLDLPLLFAPASIGLTNEAIGFLLTGNDGQRVTLEKAGELGGWLDHGEFWLDPAGTLIADPLPIPSETSLGFYRAREVPLQATPDLEFADGSHGWHVRGGRLGHTYELRASADGTNWVVLGTNQVTTTPYLHIVPASDPGEIRAIPIP